MRILNADIECVAFVIRNDCRIAGNKFQRNNAGLGVIGKPFLVGAESQSAALESGYYGFGIIHFQVIKCLFVFNMLGNLDAKMNIFITAIHRKLIFCDEVAHQQILIEPQSQSHDHKIRFVVRVVNAVYKYRQRLDGIFTHIVQRYLCFKVIGNKRELFGQPRF